MSFIYGPSGKTWVVDPVPAVVAPPTVPTKAPPVVRLVPPVAAVVEAVVAPSIFEPWSANGFTADLLPVHAFDAPADVTKAPGKAPMLKEWATRPAATGDDIAKWSTWPNANVGLRAASWPAFDIDVDDLAIADAIELVIIEHLGATPVRRRSNSARRLLPFVLRDLPFPKVVVEFTTPSGERAKVEVLAEGQQYVVAGTHHTGAELTWTPAMPVAADLPELSEATLASTLERIKDKLVELGCVLADSKKVIEPQATPVTDVAGTLTVLRSPTDRAHGKRRAAAYVAKMDPAVAGQGGHDQMFSAACRAVELVLHEDDAVAVLSEYNARAVPPFEQHEVERKVAEASKHHRLGEKFDDVAAAPAPTTDAQEAPLPDAVCYVRSAQAYFPRTESRITWDLKTPMNAAEARRELISRGGMTPAAATTAIAEHTVLDAVTLACDPSQPSIFERAGYRVVNTFVPPTIVTAAGEWPVLSEVLDFLTAGDKAARRWLTNWVAFAAQHPARMMKTAPVLYGQQSTGKSLIYRALSELIGTENCFTTDGEDLATQFTLHYATKLLLGVEEIDAVDVPHVTSKLKRLTGTPEARATGKGANPFMVQNRLKLFLMSNSTLPVKVEGKHDKRWSIFFQPVPPSDEYLDRMAGLFTLDGNDWNARGMAEVAAFGHYLKHYAVDSKLAFSVHRSAARDSAIDASRTTVEMFADALEASYFEAVRSEYLQVAIVRDAQLADRPEILRASEVYAVYAAFAKANGNQAMANNRFVQALKAARPEWEHNERTRAGTNRIATWAGIPRARGYGETAVDTADGDLAEMQQLLLADSTNAEAA